MEQNFGRANPEIAVVRRMLTAPQFMKVLRRRAPLDMVATNGAVGVNRSSFKHVAAQRDVLWLALRGLAESNSQAIDDVLRGLEYGFERQTSNGNFANGMGASDLTAVGADAFFLQSYGRARLLIGASPYALQTATRFGEMDRHVPRALSWLLASEEELFRQDRNTTNRLFFDALALGLCGKIVDDTTAIAKADEFVQHGISAQRADGTFNEHGGYDSSYQAVSLINIAVWLLNPPANLSEQLTAALRSGAAWQMSRIKSNGEVMTEGNARTGVGLEGDKDVNYFEVALSCIYLAEALGDESFMDTGERVSRYINRNA